MVLSKKNKFSDTGFSLVEVMITMGISTVMMLAITQAITQNQRQTKMVEYGIDYNNAVNTLSTLVQNESACTALFLNRTFLFAPGTPASAVPVSANVNYSGSLLFTINGGTPTAPGINISSVQIYSAQAPSNPFAWGSPSVNYKKYDASIIVSGSKWVTNSSGTLQQVGGTSSKRIPVTVLTGVAGGTLDRVQHCYGAGTSGGLSEQDVCNLMGANYDPSVTPHCVFNSFEMADNSADRGTWGSSEGGESFIDSKTLVLNGNPAQTNGMAGIRIGHSSASGYSFIANLPPQSAPISDFANPNLLGILGVLMSPASPMVHPTEPTLYIGGAFRTGMTDSRTTIGGITDMHHELRVYGGIRIHTDATYPAFSGSGAGAGVGNVIYGCSRVAATAACAGGQQIAACPAVAAPASFFVMGGGVTCNAGHSIRINNASLIPSGWAGACVDSSGAAQCPSNVNALCCLK